VKTRALKTHRVAVAAVLAGAPALATPPNIEVIYSRAPGAPTSVAPGAVDNSGNPVVTNFVSMLDFWLSPDGTRWMLRGATSQDADSANIVLLGGGVSGTMLLQEGRPFPGAVGSEVVDFFSGSTCYPFNQSNDFAMALRARGGVASVFQKLVRYTGGVGAVRFQMGDAYTGMTDNPPANSGNEIIGNSASSISLQNNGVIGWHDPAPGNLHSSRYPVAAYDGVKFLQSNVDTVTRIDGSGPIGLSSISSTGTISVFWTSLDGTRVAVRGKADINGDGSSLSDPDCIVVDGQIRAQVNMALPGNPAIMVATLTQTWVAANNDWYMRGTTGVSPNASGWVVRNGAVIAQAGTPIGSDSWGASLYTVAGNVNGSWVVTGKSSNTDPAFDDVLVVDGQVVVREGDAVPIDINGDGNPETAFIGRGNNALVAFPAGNCVGIAPDGRIYALVNLRTDASGGSDLASSGTPVALIRITPGAACGSADFNCDGDTGTDADIEAFFSCLAGTCPALPCVNGADFNGDGDVGTDADIEAFFRVLGGANC